MRHEFFSTARELERGGRPFATATVVRVEPPTSAKPGDKAIITAEGELRGWVGGSCARPTVIREALAALGDDRSRLVRLSSRPDQQGGRQGVTDLSMTCFSGGTMEIFIEPHQPRPRLLLVGGSPMAEALAALARVMGYRVVGVPDAEGGEAPAGVDEQAGGVDRIGDLITPWTYVVVASHGRGDEIAVEAALRAGAAYVGLVASRKRAGAIRGHLEKRGLGGEELAALKVPAGLDIHARHPEEIALSILAEIVRRRRERPEQAAVAAAPEAETAVGASEEATALDPVCGMQVEIEGAVHRHDHRGKTYYFCCAGCLARFADDPEIFLERPRAAGR